MRVQNNTKDIAFLVYSPERIRLKNNSFDGNYNIGAKVIIDVMERAGIAIDYCSPETAGEYKTILVSFTSTYDIYAFYKAVSLLSTWQRPRTFKVIGGGFGMQNPMTIRNYVDVAIFGRAEDIIVDVITEKITNHPGIMFLPDITPVKINQISRLYGNSISLRTGGTTAQTEWKESFVGCINKCKFCHYTWSRKWLSKDETYKQGSLTMEHSMEILWKDIFSMEKKEGRIRTAVDGCSERLRFLFGKKITDKDIKNGIEYIGKFEGITVLLVYNIGNMPGETEDDIELLYKSIQSAKPKNRVIVVVHTTPFRPSLVTPMQYFGVKIYPDWHDRAKTVVYDSDKLRVVNSFTLESSYSHLMSMIVERATEKTDKLFHAICFSPRLKGIKNKKKVKMIELNFDLQPYLKEYHPEDDNFPGHFLSSYTSREKLSEYFKSLKEKIDQKE